MRRRDFLKLTTLAATAAGGPGAQAQTAPNAPAAAGAPAATPADLTLTIDRVTVALAPSRIISTTGYNGRSPGPVLRMKEGVPVTVEVINNTDLPEVVHWHGLQIPGEVDGVVEEGTPLVPAQGRRSYTFTPTPAGTRWYHSHMPAMTDLYRGTYSGQFGFLIVEGPGYVGQPGQFDQEVFLALRDWEPFFTTQAVDTDDLDPSLPQPERPAVLDTRPSGWELGAEIYSINDRALGAGEPIRVRRGERVMLHVLNASAIENRHLSLPGHRFQILALDGNAVPKPAAVEVLLVGPGERIDCIVEMNNPGVWILGEPVDAVRNAGLGVIVEYAGQNQQAQWQPPRQVGWDYTLFGNPTPPPLPPNTMDMVFEMIPRGEGMINTFTVNGVRYPHGDQFLMQAGERYRLTFRNRTSDAHPLHLHRHTFELAEIYGKPTSGVMKDTVVVPLYGRAAVDFTAAPGLSLFHCHIQAHMDYGFMALLRAGR